MILSFFGGPFAKNFGELLLWKLPICRPMPRIPRTTWWFGWWVLPLTFFFGVLPLFSEITKEKWGAKFWQRIPKDLNQQIWSCSCWPMFETPQPMYWPMGVSCVFFVVDQWGFLLDKKSSHRFERISWKANDWYFVGWSFFSPDIFRFGRLVVPIPKETLQRMAVSSAGVFRCWRNPGIFFKEILPSWGFP